MALIYEVDHGGKGASALSLDVFEYALNTFTAGPHRVCLTLFTSNLELLSRIRDELGVHASVFIWKEFRNDEFLTCGLVDEAAQAKLVADNLSVSMAREWDQPAYDWNEIYGGDLRFHFSHVVWVGPNPPPDRYEVDASEAQRVKDAAASGEPLGRARDPRFRASNSISSDQIKHIFTFIGSPEQRGPVLRSLSGMLGAATFVGGFEVPLNRSLASETQYAGEYNYNERRDDPVRFGMHSFRFAIDADGLMHPAPNCDLACATDLVRRVWADLDGSALYLGRSYLPWVAGESKFASKTGGNFCTFFRELGNAGVRIGIEQYSDKDFPVRRVRDSIDLGMSSKGWRLRRVVY